MTCPIASDRLAACAALVGWMFPTNSHCDDGASSIEMPRILLDTRLAPASLVEGAMDATSVVVFGQRPQLWSGKRRRGRPAVPEQASLFGFS